MEKDKKVIASIGTLASIVIISLIPFWEKILSRITERFDYRDIFIMNIVTAMVAIIIFIIVMVITLRKKDGAIALLNSKKDEEIETLKQRKDNEILTLKDEIISQRKKLKTANNVLNSLWKINENKLIQLIPHIDDNFEEKSFGKVITDPKEQLRVTLTEFEEKIKVFFGSPNIEIHSNLHYKILDEDWNCIRHENASPCPSKDLAEDKRSTMYSVIHGTRFAFHNKKQGVVKDDRDDSRLDNLYEPRYLRRDDEVGPEDLLGSIICICFTVTSNKNTDFVKAVIGLETKHKPFIDSEDKQIIDGMKKIIEETIFPNYERIFKNELAILFMKETSREVCSVCV